jgi:hypothetical protein
MICPNGSFTSVHFKNDMLKSSKYGTLPHTSQSGTTMKESLLATEHDEEHDISTTPLLGSHDYHDDIASNNPEDMHDFARLLSIVHAVHPDDTTQTPPFRSRRALENRSSSRPLTNLSQSSSSLGHSRCSPAFVTVAAGACSILHLGFVWASFVATNWSETSISVELPFLPSTLVPVTSTSLSTLIQSFVQTNQIGVSVLIWITSLLVPCLVMVLTPSWIVQVYSASKSSPASLMQEEHWIRDILHLAVRWSFTVVYVLGFIFLSSQFVALEWTNTLVSVQNKVDVGLASFTVGISFALIAIGVLRLHSAYNRFDDSHPRISAAPVVPEPDRPTVSPTRLYADDGEATATMRILEDDPILTSEPTQVHGNDMPRHRAAHETMPTRGRLASDAKLPNFCETLLVFQLGLVAILAWIPAITLPAVQFELSGFASEFIPGNSTKSISLYQVPLVLYRGSLAATTPPWIIWLMASLMLSWTVLCPILASVLSIATWMLPTDPSPYPARWSRSSCRTWLYAIQPAASGIVLALALFIAVHGIEPWSEIVFNSVAGKASFESLVGEACLTIRGSPMIGAWFYVVHACLLEVFIALTLRWA